MNKTLNSISKPDYVVKKMKEHLSLVYEKLNLLKLYNYWNCYRDPKQFKHLEQKYGIANSTDIKFTPLVKSHIDAIIGEYISNPITHKISCKDQNTLSNILREKQLMISEEVFSFYKSKLNSEIFKIFIDGAKDKIPQDPLIQQELDRLVNDLDLSYTSEYEIAAQNIIDYLQQWDVFDFKVKMKTLMRDLLVAGACYYRVRIINKQPRFEVLHPLNTFIDRNINSIYFKDSPRAVVRRYLNIQNILEEYGEYLSESEVDKLTNSLESGLGMTQSVFMPARLNSKSISPTMYNIFDWPEAYPIAPFADVNKPFYANKIEVKDVEWIETIKENGKYINYLCEGTMIGASIYITKGVNKECYRTELNPSYTRLSVNGMFYGDATGEPFSMVNATMDLQDMFDLVNWYKANAIANAGNKGLYLDISQIPSEIGGGTPKGISRVLDYKKQGLLLVNSSQDGRLASNTVYTDYDDSLAVNTIQAYELAIESIKNTVASITGVFKERLGGIEQRDAVANVKMGMQNSFIITNQYTLSMDLLAREVLSDGLRACKQAFKDGIYGTLVLGDKGSKIFKALPEHYVFTDFDIHINSSSEINKEIETIKQLTFEMLKAGIVDVEVILETVGATSLTKLKHDVKTSVKKKKDENDQLSQAIQQIEQLNQTTKELTKTNQQLEENNLQLKDEMLKNKANFDKEKLNLDRKKIDADIQYKNKDIELKEKQIKAEVLQLYDNNPNNNEIKNIT